MKWLFHFTTSRCPSLWPTEIRNGNLKAILGLFFSLSRYKQQQQQAQRQPSLPSQGAHPPLSQQSSAPAQLGHSPAHGTPALSAQRAAQADMQSRWGSLLERFPLDSRGNLWLNGSVSEFCFYSSSLIHDGIASIFLFTLPVIYNCDLDLSVSVLCHISLLLSSRDGSQSKLLKFSLGQKKTSRSDAPAFCFLAPPPPPLSTSSTPVSSLSRK